MKLSSLPKGTKLMSSTWVMKKKSNDTLRPRMYLRSFEQIEGKHYEEDKIHSPVTNETSVRIVMILGIIAGWYSQIVDMKRAFLCGRLDQKKERTYIKYLKGLKGFMGLSLY